MPSPICLQSLTVLRCSASGCRSSPSSSTSFSALTAMFTVLLKSSQSNLPLSANAARLIAPSKHEPPAGSGSSAPHTTYIKYSLCRALDCRIRFRAPLAQSFTLQLRLRPVGLYYPSKSIRGGFTSARFIRLTDLHQHIQMYHHCLLDSN